MNHRAIKIWNEHLRMLEIKAREIRHIPLRAFVPQVEQRIHRSAEVIRDLLRYDERKQEIKNESTKC